MRTEQEMLLAFRKAGFEHAVSVAAAGLRPTENGAMKLTNELAQQWPEFDHTHFKNQYQEVVWAVARHRETIRSLTYRQSANPDAQAITLFVQASNLEGLEVIRDALRKTDRAYDWSQTIHTPQGCEATFFIESRPDERWPGLQEEEYALDFGDETVIQGGEFAGEEMACIEVYGDDLIAVTYDNEWLVDGVAVDTAEKFALGILKAVEIARTPVESRDKSE